MKQKFAAVAIVVIALVMIAPHFVFADHNNPDSNVLNPLTTPFALTGPLVVCTGTGNNSGGTNFPTCNNLCDLVAQIANVIYFAIAVVLWVIAPILLVVGGIMIMLTGASPEMISTGKKTITGAVWGVVIVLLAWLLVSTFVTVLNIKGVGGFGTSACNVSAANSNTNTNTTNNTDTNNGED